MEAQREVVRANKHESCYMRPIAFYGSEKMGVSPIGAKVHVAIAAWPWGAYLGPDALEKGIRVKTSSYARHHVNVTMARAKMSGTYPNSMLATLEATQHGYDEGLLLDVDGFVAEGAGENIFIVKDGRVYEPELTSALTGITRASVIDLRRRLGYEVRAKRLTRDDIYIADEAFFTGTAAEVTPIRELDGRADRRRQARARSPRRSRRRSSTSSPARTRSTATGSPPVRQERANEAMTTDTRKRSRDHREAAAAALPDAGAPLWARHPRVFLDVAREGESRCPYCGTLYVYKGAPVKGH